METKPKKRRNLLASYYQEAPVEASPFDSEAFSIEADMRQSQDMSLADLIGKENKLVGEIKKCDVEMKQLIYENYSKFVFASKTLQDIHSSCNFMTTSLEDLDSRCFMR